MPTHAELGWAAWEAAEAGPGLCRACSGVHSMCVSVLPPQITCELQGQGPHPIGFMSQGDFHSPQPMGNSVSYR